MNETLQVIHNRYSCRGFDGKAINKKLLEAIALAGAASPSARNQQLWEIVVITDKGLIGEMDAEGMRILSELQDKSFYQRFMDRGGTLFYNAPCMFLILIRPGTELDCGIVSENIALAASSLGLGNVICGMAKIPFDGPKSAEFKKRIGFPDGWEFGMSVLVGNATVTKAPHEPDLTKIRFVE